MHRTSAIAAAALGVAVALGSSTPAHAATPVATWYMDETSGVMNDSGSYDNDGIVGSAVKQGVAYGSSKGYQFTSPGETVDTDDRNLVLVSDANGSLDPGSRNVRITVDVTTTDSDANILLKGQAGTPGGRYKVEINAGRPACQFQGSVRERTATWGSKITDGRPHTIVCEKLADRVRVSVDGMSPVTAWNGVGSISNGKKLAIGGKHECNAGTVDCDYYTGTIGRALIAFG